MQKIENTVQPFGRVNADVRLRPILFRTELIPQIIDNIKTQTRRIITKRNSSCGSANFDDLDLSKAFIDDYYLKAPKIINDDTIHRIFPKYEIDDQFYVKETYCEQSGDIYFKADWNKEQPVNMIFDKLKWKSSLFMPKEFSRIKLKIINIKAQRLQQLNGNDAIVEGVINLPRSKNFNELIPELQEQYKCAALDFFRELWNNINKKPGFTWNDNPWVWVIQFRVI